MNFWERNGVGGREIRRGECWMGRRIEGKKDDRDGEWKESRKGEEVVGEEE